MNEAAINIHEDSVRFTDVVSAVGGVDVSYCYQCGKCATGCPVAHEMDLVPTQLMHAIQLGLTDVVYKSKTMWLCASCLTCTTRCPQEIDIAETMNTIKIMMLRNGEKPQIPDVLKSNECFVQNLNWFGRLYELGMVGMLKLRTGKFTEDMAMGIKMLKKDKFHLIPGFEGARAVHKILKRVKKQEKS
ncbi:heterodisulfide reductase subunit C [Desulfosarcina ovata subsp. sediminis]|uniref:Heterodisulfide reductase subunit C n=1 Tax=Desulfosarcina ovata subsp. sediminis TaxID=885957 RepID=A0A5K7ZNY6_9BACT|nr:4Fe-4S dicluster domain-containing protein [Desulfosarcina ovata]BBO81459.1 heterodisulfide reductase subunit C [Desulfosarcina ovata subsp. sediminis]